MRVFLAIELPARIKAALAALQADLRQAGAQVSWTKPENLHLTLRFLGEVEPARLKRIEQACSVAANLYAPFALALAGAGFFPQAKRPRVVWAGLSGELASLTELQRGLEEQLALAGFAREDKPFHPHLTLGRIKTPRRTAALAARAELYQLPELQFTVEEIIVMQSRLHAAGSVYTPLARLPLRRPFTNDG